MLISRSCVLGSVLWLAALLVLVPLGVSWSVGMRIKCKQPERAALLDLKAAAEDLNYIFASTQASTQQKEKDAWFKWDEEDEECCNWQGVVCDATSGRVTQLRLPTCAAYDVFSLFDFSYPDYSTPDVPVQCDRADYVCGALPPSLTRLESLEVLDVRGGCFFGVPSFSSLTNLSHLDLSSNPIFTLPDLLLPPHLIYLNFSNNHYLDVFSNALNLTKLVIGVPKLQYLDLSNTYRQVEGAIPAQIGSLRNLKYLDLSNHGLQGVIPQQIGSLQNLVYLDLRENRFENPIPWRSLANLSHLSHLGLGETSYLLDPLVWPEADVSDEWHYCNWKALESLSAFNIRFASKNADSLPVCLHNPALVTQLKHLHFENPLGSTSSIAPLLRSLSHSNASLSLETLSLPSNSLWEFETQHPKPPAWLQVLHTPLLQVLDLSHNQLVRIPFWLPHLPLLHSLDMSFNNLSAPPLHHLPALKSLKLSSNLMSGAIPLILLKPSLLYLDASHNLFSGMLPFSLGNLSSLSYLDLSHNSLIGKIPQSLGDLSSLVHLDLSFNSLRGTIPPSVGNMSNLVRLDLRSNKQLSGSIPLSIGDLSSLQILSLSGNSLTGTIPARIFQDSLFVVNVSENQLVGSLPKLQNCSSLSKLYMSNNLLGSLLELDAFQNCPFLAKLDLSNNRFSSSLLSPINFHSLCIQLNSLDISKNLLGGEVPKELASNCSNLEFLDLSDNNLSGALQPEIGNMSQLAQLGLSNNFLSSDIPASLGNLPSLQILALHNNKLHGRLPPSLQNCSSLEILDLGSNQLSGSIPEWLNGQNFPLLQVLMLSCNRFQSSTPLLVSLLQNFTGLQILGLASNYLHGSLPRNVNRLEAMSRHPESAPAFYGAINVQITLKRIQELLIDRNLLFTAALDFSDNLLEGGIPAEIGALQGLFSLNLSHNSLNGSIPSSLGKLAGVLESLDLSNNELTGSVPPELCYFDSLGVLDLSHNRLQGAITLSPSCTHLCSFDASSFASNEGLRYECDAATNSITQDTHTRPPQEAAAAAAADADSPISHHTSLLGKLHENISVAGWGTGHVIGFVLMALFLHHRAPLI